MDTGLDASDQNLCCCAQRTPGGGGRHLSSIFALLQRKYLALQGNSVTVPNASQHKLFPFTIFFASFYAKPTISTHPLLFRQSYSLETKAIFTFNIGVPI